MSMEMTVLALGCIFGIIQVFVAAQLQTRQNGLAWSLSSREAAGQPPTPLAGRLKRAQANFLETFPFAASALLAVEVTGANNTTTELGAIVWLSARLAFWLAYAIGIPVLRSVLFATSIIGIGLVLWPLLA
ncbi:MAPEG family protein [Ensifer adhaerens]|uniref:MAPEG family protein n=1 Tax=Ensifer adhaerens TaxID=106592 RepID=UPI001445C691|nr:MAPEG family protein [Ensifer adhaerens]MDF8355056.1 MAPEG family protein [Ensifer adhaerens]